MRIALQSVTLLCAFFGLFHRSAAAAGVDFNYLEGYEEEWNNLNHSVCGTGMRQSPINVVADNAIKNDDLIELMLMGWGEERVGMLKNLNGNTVKFTPNEDQSVASTMVHQGTYNVAQFHVHWGPNNAVGSEHQMNGAPTAAEIHFVHRKTDGEETDGNAYAVVGVMAVADDSIAVTGVWSTLKISDVSDYDGTAEVTIRFSDLLPEDRSYYYYEGSLTTPLCNEVVQWFLLKNTISVPSAFLAQLRLVEQADDGTPLLNNYRNVQALNGRTVAAFDSGATVGQKPILSLLTASIFVAIFALFKL